MSQPSDASQSASFPESSTPAVPAASADGIPTGATVANATAASLESSAPAAASLESSATAVSTAAAATASPAGLPADATAATASAAGTPAAATASSAASPTRKTSRLTVPDLISIGVFTALYFVCVTIATFASALVAGFGTVFLPAVAALICGCVYMLMVARVGKFGGITVMGAVMGLFLFVSGHFVLSFVASLVFPIVADLIARAGRYRSRVGILASYVVFSYGLTGPILPLWFMKDAYVASLEARGKDAAYIDALFAHISMGSFVVAMLAILVCALLGGWFGQRMMRKHFAKAGII